MNDSPASVHRQRVGLRAVARAARVCLQTASLALRNSPRLSAPTRQRVRALAEKLGYRPDPEIARLMSRLRPSRKLHRSVVIAMIDLHRRKSAQLHPYDAGVRQGITTRADLLGYGATVLGLADYRGNLGQLLQVIRHRGITGVVLLPSTDPIALDPAIDWSGISVVAATTTVTAPQFHQVAPNQLHNISALIESLRARGCRRIGAILEEGLDRRTHHHYSIALTWYGHARRVLVVPAGLSESALSERVSAWMQRHCPEVILGGELMEVLRTRTPRLFRDVEIVALTSRPGVRTAYLDQRPALIGECAVSLLTGMMHNNETGIPANPQTTTIRGVVRAPGPVD